jgi:hypothetical protein
MESAKLNKKIPIIKDPQDILIAIFRPQLSAINGITKNPTKDPMYRKDVNSGFK